MLRTNRIVNHPLDGHEYSQGRHSNDGGGCDSAK